MCGEIKIRSKKRKKYLIFLLSTCKVYNLFHYHIACIQQFLTNGCYMFLVSGFHNDTKGTSGDICTLTISLMMYRNYISSLLCDNFADSQQLPRLVYQVQSYCIGTSRLPDTRQTAFLPFTGTLLNMAAATDTAPAPSATIRWRSINARIAAAISSSVTVTTPSTY